MNRRQFTKSLAALAATPALPVKAFAGASGATAATVATPNLYTWGQMIARTHQQCSPGMLSRLLKIDLSRAASIHARLLRNGVVGPADAFGISRAIKPMYQNISAGAGKLRTATVPNAPSAETVVERHVVRPSGQDDPGVVPDASADQDSPGINHAGARSSDADTSEISCERDPDNRDGTA